MGKFKTDQEGFWAGEFGDSYVSRNQGESWVESNRALFQKILSRVGTIRSVIEFGANRGLNLEAIKHILPDVSLSGIEINATAVRELQELGFVKVHHQSILDFLPDELHDLVLIKGVLIHINPEYLPKVYELLYRSSSRYICIAEYYNPVPVEVDYRGHAGKLFKRDFAGEMLDLHPDLRLVDYGFVYHKDPRHPQDDITWFLLSKTDN